VNGQKFRPGEIVAAELTTQDKNLRAVRFSFSKNQTGYYTPKGNSLESRFLSYPLRFKHISSQFSYHRMDPISHLNRPHLGIDFSAENGTPVQAIGNGRITFVGNVNGYGKMIKVSFDRHYSAMYAHLARFASDLKINQEIHKGQTIGYVGSTGWSTGPHLHFGFFLNGVATNWLAMKPSAASIPSRYFKKFLATSHKILAELQFRQATKFAANNNTQLNSHATD
jgi:murein DD-endopeptidase MepM/ murein hydrolase activator NlpD